MPSSKELSEIFYNIYDGTSISLNGLVSEINIVYRDSFPEVPEEWASFLQQQKSETPLYSKKFHIQKGDDIHAEMHPDPRYEVTAYNHLVSDAYPIAGAYHKGIPLENIEQYFAYVGVGLQSSPYIDLISSRQLLSAKHLRIATGLKASQIGSLQDDVQGGKIEIIMPDETKYQSLNIVKDTVISDVCVLSFKRT
jgi:hypothetical protein